MSETTETVAATNRGLMIPLIVFLLLVVLLYLGFSLKDPHILPSELINKPFPVFELRDLHQPGQMLTREDLLGEVALVNVWATWCPNCVVEHPELLRISREENIPLYGVNYNDEIDKALAWLARREDPYRFSIVDDEGTLAIDLGVYGAPETFVLDREGVIRYRHVGPVTPVVWRDEIQPVVELVRQVSSARGSEVATSG